MDVEQAYISPSQFLKFVSQQLSQKCVSEPAMGSTMSEAAPPPSAAASAGNLLKLGIKFPSQDSFIRKARALRSKRVVFKAGKPLRFIVNVQCLFSLCEDNSVKKLMVTDKGYPVT